jgi:hypothetical protein
MKIVSLIKNISLFMIVVLTVMGILNFKFKILLFVLLAFFLTLSIVSNLLIYLKKK